ncbi:hypothetical protein Z042_21870 [Chania multitudinisentens RB-25]|uniref:PA14 domain-containing protein n=2 Tax=Chania TaxID=1745211 RepID=W0LJ07_9GAMM|nr:hypothetical protein Z042_21870 [Chania multitudinisentens RB-25]
MNRPQWRQDKKTLKLLSGLLCFSALTLAGCDNSTTDSQGGGDKIEHLLTQMTLEEKTSFLHGLVKGFDMSDFGDPENKANVGFIPGVPRLNIPPLRLTDGPAGARYTKGLTTAMPAPVSLAASFNPVLAEQYGAAIGAEARALDQDVLLAPMVNIVRIPGAGRNFETFGEDPLLAGEMASAEIIGIQNQGVMATIKHFAANNQETDRMTINTIVDERTMREIYLPAFEQGVNAGVASFMCSYNRLAIDGKNSDYACANKTLLTDILRTQWKYDGFVMTDWYAAVMGGLQGLEALTPAPLSAGLDMEMPGGNIFGTPLLDAVQRKEMPESTVDKAVYRILTQMDKFHLLDGTPPAKKTIDELKDQNSIIAKETAIEGAVLLVNENNTLPLQATSITSLAVIGQTAASLNYGGGGSSRVKPLNMKAPLASIEERLADGLVTYQPGVDLDGIAIPASALSHDLGQPGLLRNDGSIDSALDFTIANLNPLEPNGKQTITWSGSLTAPTTGDYELKIQVKNGGASLKIGSGDQNGNPQIGIASSSSVSFADISLISTRDGLQWAGYKIHLEAGVPQPITITAIPGAGSDFATDLADPLKPTSFRLAWMTPELKQQRFDDAVNAAQTTSNVVLFAYTEGNEGKDLIESINLPEGQDALIQAVVDANPNTVVVLNVGSSIEMPWLDGAQKPAALLNMWYPGQEGADATADILFGQASPGGRLPISIPFKLADYTPANEPQSFPGVDDTVIYEEGIFVGYRWYDQHNVAPRFAFGHGLSYTQFSYSEPTVTATAEGYSVSFSVTNTGATAGVDVPQVYLGAPASAAVPMVKKALAGFSKVKLAAGESTQVTIPIAKRALSYWDINTAQWQVATGQRSVYLGSSASNVEEIAQIQVTK